MNWITNFVKPKLQSFVGKKEVPENLWETCPKCSQMILKRELKAALYVCKHCDHHFRINAKDRLQSFFGYNFMIIETPKIKIRRNVLETLKPMRNANLVQLFDIMMR